MSVKLIMSSWVDDGGGYIVNYQEPWKWWDLNWVDLLQLLWYKMIGSAHTLEMTNDHFPTQAAETHFHVMKCTRCEIRVISIGTGYIHQLIDSSNPAWGSMRGMVDGITSFECENDNIVRAVMDA